ncbi:hypothetical protein ACS0TY_003067 [Phlomoides rotata]
MAMRPRGGGAAAPRARSQLVRPVYEDFKPVSEWQQDDDSHILNIYLPGFMKEQIKVSTERRNTIRVTGERLVAGNKWNRFREDFQVPENGEIISVSAKFQGGILTVTVPKVKVAKTESIADMRKQSTPQKDREKEVGTSKATDEEGIEPRKSSRDTGMELGQDGDLNRPITQKGQDNAFPAVGTSTPMGEKILEPEKTTAGDSMKERDQDDGQRGRSFTPLKKTLVSHDNVKNEGSESKEKQSASERPDDVRKTNKNKDDKESVVNKELPDVETASRTKVEKGQARDILEKNADKKGLYEASTKEKYKKNVKGLTELNEERQLLVNMGAAMLVILALTAYVTYGFVSVKDKN